MDVTAGHPCSPWFYPFHNDEEKLCNPLENIEMADFVQKASGNDQCLECLPGDKSDMANQTKLNLRKLNYKLFELWPVL